MTYQNQDSSHLSYFSTSPNQQIFGLSVCVSVSMCVRKRGGRSPQKEKIWKSDADVSTRDEEVILRPFFDFKKNASQTHKQLTSVRGDGHFMESFSCEREKSIDRKQNQDSGENKEEREKGDGHHLSISFRFRDTTSG